MDLSRLVQEMPKIEDPLDSDNDAPVIRMINVLLTQALRQKASDIHIEPYDARSVVRFRLDGTLHTVAEPHRALHAAMLSRIKIMANLDIAEKRLPQDGRISLRLAGTPGRRARRDAADRLWRARGAAPARQGSEPARARRPGHGRRARSPRSTS